ncbi:MAG: hypothetical protein Q7J07_05220 [Pelolinea sp.]|nr:hypothetical protein [Pelolinea sp.]
METIIVGELPAERARLHGCGGWMKKQRSSSLKEANIFPSPTAVFPYHIGNVITERNRLLVVTPEILKETFNIDARVRHEAVSIDRKKKTLQYLSKNDHNKKAVPEVERLFSFLKDPNGVENHNNHSL